MTCINALFANLWLSVRVSQLPNPNAPYWGRLALSLRTGSKVLVSIAHNLVSTTGDPAYAVDGAARIVAWNKAAEQTFGYAQSAAVGANCWELLQGRDIFGNQYCDQRCPHREMAARGKPINRCRMQFRLTGGTYAEFILSTLAWQEPSGRWLLIHLCRPETTRRDSLNRTSSTANPFKLTRREREVLGHLAAGGATTKIATTLNISIPTVRNHIEHILRKLECHSRLEAVAAARRHQLV